MTFSELFRMCDNWCSDDLLLVNMPNKLESVLPIDYIDVVYGDYVVKRFSLTEVLFTGERKKREYYTYE